MVNLPGALVDMQSDVGISYYDGNEVMVNQGTVRKSGGSGTSVLQPTLNNSGTLDAESGTLSLYNGNGAGLFLTGAGARWLTPAPTPLTLADNLRGREPIY